MSHHKVLALKYRPKNFGELVGQESASQTLSLALDSGKLSHAYLFSGLRGSGKTSTARIFAKALLCEAGISSTPCETCSSCIQANENHHIDIIELDAASNRRIDDIRDLIEQTKYAPATSRFKIFIIDEVHMLTKEAFNALLKTLEEPPPYVKFLLATTDPLKLPPTILSRVQHFRFRKIAHKDIVNQIQHILTKENIEFEPQAIDLIARAGDGSMRDTLTLLEQAIIFGDDKVSLEKTTDMLGVLEPKEIERFFELVLSGKNDKLLEFIASIEHYDSETVIESLISHLKTMLYSQDPTFTPLLIERFFRVLSDAKSMLLSGFDSSFTLILTTFKLVECLKVEFIEDEIKRLESEITTQNDTPTTPVPQKEVDLFKELTRKIYDRSAQLGEVFDKNIEFVSFENNELKWASCAKDSDKERLKNDYHIIRTLVQEVYGIHTKISNVPCQKEQTTPQIDPIPEIKPVLPPEPPRPIQEPQTDQNKVLESSFIQKAIDIFEPTKISIIDDDRADMSNE